MKEITESEHGIAPAQINPNALEIVERLNEAGHEAYLVGGCLRDLLLGIPPKDFDVATSAHPEQVRSLFRNSRLIGRRFRLAHIRHGRETTEVATFRAGGEHWDSADSEADAELHVETGRILRDNVYGTLETDAARRDFTINALYLRPADWTVLDFSDGIGDLRKKKIRVLGTPAERFREDPVRMLRAARLQAKLGLKIGREEEEAIRKLGKLLVHVPPARLFDEYTKLFMHGHAVRSMELLDEYGLTEYLFPTLAEYYPEQPEVAALVRQALVNTDERVANDQRITPAFLIAVFLWPEFLEQHRAQLDAGDSPLEACNRAAHAVIMEQCQSISIPKRFSMVVKDIWDLQFRLPNNGNRKRAVQLLDHRRFRAAYDFLLLREMAGENLEGLGEWWTRFQEEDHGPRPERTDEDENEDEESEERAPRRPRGEQRSEQPAGPRRRRRRRRRRRPAPE